MINCKKCGDNCHIFDSKFKCSDGENFGESYRTKIYASIVAVGQMDDGDPEKFEFLEELLDSLTEEHKRRRKDNSNNNFRKSLYLID